jgi:hypothetical protein
MSLMLSKLLSSAESAEQGKEDSEDPPDVKQILVDSICKEISVSLGYMMMLRRSKH